MRLHESSRSLAMLVALLLQLVLVPLHVVDSHHAHVDFDGAVKASAPHHGGGHHHGHHHDHDGGDRPHAGSDHTLVLAAGHAPAGFHATAWVDPTGAVTLPELLPVRRAVAGASGEAPDTGPPRRPSARGPPMA